MKKKKQRQGMQYWYINGISKVIFESLTWPLKTWTGLAYVLITISEENLRTCVNQSISTPVIDGSHVQYASM